MPLQFRRGTESEIQNIVPSAGEPIWTTDTKNLYIGDGSTLGGNLISGGGGVQSNQALYTTSSVTFNQVSINAASLNLGLSGYGGVAGDYSTRIGSYSRADGYKSVALGSTAVANNEFNIAIGSQAGNSSGLTITNASNSIIINAQGNTATNSGVNLVAPNSGLYIAPIRASTGTEVLFYDTTTKEITYGAGAGGGNPFDQSLNTTSTVSFAGLALTSDRVTLGSGAFSSGLSSLGAISIGKNSRADDNAIAIGVGAQATGPGSISIGSNAYNSNFTAWSNAIVIATGGTNVTPTNSGLFIAPIRANTGTDLLFYNTSTKEITSGGNIDLNFRTVSTFTPASEEDDTQTEIGRYSTSEGITAKWLVEVKDSNSDFHSVEILTAYKGTDTYKTEYAELTSSGAMGTFKAEHTGSSVALYFVNATFTAKTIVASKMLIKS